jgi:hypothetical protein
MNEKFIQNVIKFRNKFTELDLLLQKQIENPKENYIKEINQIKSELAILTKNVHKSYKK